MAKTTPPPGTSDLFPEELSCWYRLEDAARDTFQLYGYGEIRTPIFEYTEIFERGIGDETEVVQKEMYTFEDRGGRSLTLRPEGTAGIMRALSATDVMNGIERRVFYIGPMFRGERPAAGRRRQFHQIGVENAGRIHPDLDVESIAMLMHYLEKLNIKGSRLLLNTRGRKTDRDLAEEALKTYFSDFMDSMCEDCGKRLSQNIWRILDCKQSKCQGIIDAAPDIVTYFSDETRSYFDSVCTGLTDLGIEYEITPRLVRGLDYYVDTVFEIVHSALGGQDSIAGGGRYEVILPGQKKPLPGVGFALGMERLLMVQEALGVPVPDVAVPLIFLVGLGADAVAYNMKLAMELRKNNVPVVVEVEDKSMKAQMRTANRIKAEIVLICGESELEKKTLICKNMIDGEQEEVSRERIVDHVFSMI